MLVLVDPKGIREPPVFFVLQSGVDVGIGVRPPVVSPAEIVVVPAAVLLRALVALSHPTRLLLLSVPVRASVAGSSSVLPSVGVRVVVIISIAPVSVVVSSVDSRVAEGALLLLLFSRSFFVFEKLRLPLPFVSHAGVDLVGGQSVAASVVLVVLLF